jgi:ribose transport system permease protein
MKSARCHSLRKGRKEENMSQVSASEKAKLSDSKFEASTLKAAAKKNALIKSLTEPAALIGVVIILCVVFSLINARFYGIVNIRTILEQAAIPLILAVGSTLVILIGSIDLSIEGVMGASAMSFVLLTANTRNPHDHGDVAVLAGIATGAVFGFASGCILTKFKVPSFVVTLGMWFVGQGFATMLYGDTATPYMTNSRVSGWSPRLTFGLPNAFWAALIVVVLGFLLLNFTKLGRSAMAIGNNESIAKTTGLKIDRVKISIFTFAGALTGIAGIIGAIQLGSGSPDVGKGSLFVSVPAVVIGGTALSGGRGGVLRTMLGVFLLTILNDGLIVAGVSANYQSGVAGLILIAAIIFALWSRRDKLGVAK